MRTISCILLVASSLSSGPISAQSMNEDPCRWPGVDEDYECRGVHQVKLPRERNEGKEFYTAVRVRIPGGASIKAVEAYMRSSCWTSGGSNADLNDTGYCGSYQPCNLTDANVDCQVMWGDVWPPYERTQQMSDDFDVVTVYFRSWRDDNTRWAAVRVLFQ